MLNRVSGKEQSGENLANRDDDRRVLQLGLLPGGQPNATGLRAAGNRLIFEKLKKKDVIRLEFPLTDFVESHTFFARISSSRYSDRNCMKLEKIPDFSGPAFPRSARIAEAIHGHVFVVFEVALPCLRSVQPNTSCGSCS